MSSNKPSAIMSLWTVYEKPKDFPNSFVARRHEITAGESRPTQDALVGDSLEQIREDIQRMRPGLVRIDRSPDDDPVIVEIWI